MPSKIVTNTMLRRYLDSSRAPPAADGAWAVAACVMSDPRRGQARSALIGPRRQAVLAGSRAVAECDFGRSGLNHPPHGISEVSWPAFLPSPRARPTRGEPAT